MVRQLFLSICHVEKVWLSEWCIKVPETNIICGSLLNLRTVEISWYFSDASAIPAIRILFGNAHNLEKIVFRPSWIRGHQQELLHSAVVKVLCLPRSSPTAEVVVIEESLV
ncbi:hypothetical protein C2S52_014537 [Perilla frutescens var. hirtella]|nr:hypothetical protein C2S52_014537 [Perilla frutescens var. hirtella]